eukprot:11352924-Karenia_brevis.AAC.1
MLERGMGGVGMGGWRWMWQSYAHRLHRISEMQQGNNLGQRRAMCAISAAGQVRNGGVGRQVLPFNLWCLKVWVGCLRRRM